MNLKNKLHKMFNFLLCSLQIHKIEVCLNLCYIFIKARELYRQKIHFFCLMHTWEYTIIWIIAHLKPQRITDCLHKNVEEVNQVYLPDLGHTCRLEDKRFSYTKKQYNYKIQERCHLKLWENQKTCKKIMAQIWV
jgi:hypothetical protein